MIFRSLLVAPILLLAIPVHAEDARLGGSPSVLAVTDASFDKLVASSQVPVVVFGSADWCGPCRRVGPAADALQASMQGRVQFAIVNDDDNPNVPAELKMMSIPTFVIFRGGSEIARHVGELSQVDLAAWINKAIGS